MLWHTLQKYVEIPSIMLPANKHITKLLYSNEVVHNRYSFRRFLPCNYFGRPFANRLIKIKKATTV